MQCRPDPLLRDRDTPEDFLETLCDIGAAELLLPIPWFTNDAVTVRTAQGLVILANRYKASREATVRRFAETHSISLAALFFSWKLKPKRSAIIQPRTEHLFGIDPAEEALAARQLRRITPFPAIDSSQRASSCPRTNHWTWTDRSGRRRTASAGKDEAKY